MHIAVISDTHDKLDPRLLDLLNSADEIWHLGDVCNPNTLSSLYSLGRYLQIVRGNNDYTDWPLVINRKIHDHMLYVTHIPPTTPPPKAQIVLHGHTHLFRDETTPDGIRWLNPGSISFPRKEAHPSFAWLEICPKKPVRWTPVFIPQ